jgi:hypothetical protein
MLGTMGSIVRRAARALSVAALLILVVATALAAAVAEGLVTLPSGGGGPSPAVGDTATGPSAAPTFAFEAEASTDGDPVLVGAGDIADCTSTGDSETADLIDRIPGAVFAAGDIAYEDGTADQVRDCYGPTWGRFKDRTRPIPGNRDWRTEIEPYLAYWGDHAVNGAGDPWYSWELGAWHIAMLDSDCTEVRGCGPDSKQGRWLVDDLSRSKARCTLAIWHHPRFSSGEHGPYAEAEWFWETFQKAGADVVISGHDHDYERFEPIDAAGKVDPARGMRLFVVGTGGGELSPLGSIDPRSSVRIDGTYGVLRLVLHPAGYDWQFIAGDGTVGDSGSGACH